MWVLPLNFKLLVLLFLATACGVKGDPIAPITKPMPSFLDNYPDIETEQQLNEYKNR